MNVYTFNGLALVIALQSFPLVFIFVKAALDLISSEMEDAANILGAGTWTAMRKVTLPLAWPSIVGSAILVFLEAVALFGPPAIIGIPARINVAATQLWQFFEFPVRVEVAAAFSMPLLLITLALITLQRRMQGRRGYVSQTGKGGARRPIELGPWRWVLFAYCALVGRDRGGHADGGAAGGVLRQGLGQRPEPRQLHSRQLRVPDLPARNPR